MDNYNNNGYNNDSWNNPQGNGPDPQQNNYSNQGYQQPYGTDNNQGYQQPNYNNMSNDEEHVSVLHWIGIFCLNIIPCVGPIVYLIMMFVWAFGSTPKKSLKNFARAQLILSAIALGIMIIISVATGAAIFSGSSSYNYY